MNAQLVTKLEDIKNDGLREFAAEQVAEAVSLGLVFRGYGHISDGAPRSADHLGGVHVFKYEWPHEDAPTVENMDRLTEFLTRDDDSQPKSATTWFFEDVWHFVPYCC